MDLWVVAAATGAGYLAKYWQSAINGEKDHHASSSVHNHQHQFNESPGISRIRDHQDRPSNIFGLKNSPERKCIWDDDQMNNITENDDKFNLESTSYGVHRHDDIIDDLLLAATKTFHPGIISVTSRNPVKPLFTMPPTVCPVLVTDGHRIINVGRNQDKEKPPPPRERTSSVDDHKDSAAATATAASGVVLFFIGITIGIMTAAKTCKGEMDYLGKQLKNSDNLVKDLIDELDMKDTIIVKELDEDHQSNQVLFMTEIETELEAELARLQIIDIRQPSVNFSEEDDDDEEKEDDWDYGNGSGNYTVSPKELKLRLYEVLESRLEARIKELEQALEISQTHERLNTHEHSNY